MAIHTNEDGTLKKLSLGGSGNFCINGIDELYKGANITQYNYITIPDGISKYLILILIFAPISLTTNVGTYSVVYTDTLKAMDGMYIIVNMMASTSASRPSIAYLGRLYTFNDDDTKLKVYMSTLSPEATYSCDWGIYGIF